MTMMTIKGGTDGDSIVILYNLDTSQSNNNILKILAEPFVFIFFSSFVIAYDAYFSLNDAYFFTTCFDNTNVI